MRLGIPWQTISFRLVQTIEPRPEAITTDALFLAEMRPHMSTQVTEPRPSRGSAQKR